MLAVLWPATPQAEASLEYEVLTGVESLEDTRMLGDEERKAFPTSTSCTTW